jgi:hypothetical protein
MDRLVMVEGQLKLGLPTQTKKGGRHG